MRHGLFFCLLSHALFRSFMHHIIGNIHEVKTMSHHNITRQFKDTAETFRCTKKAVHKRENFGKNRLTLNVGIGVVHFQRAYSLLCVWIFSVKEHEGSIKLWKKEKVSYPPGNMNVFCQVCGNLIQSIANLVLLFLIDVKEFI